LWSTALLAALERPYAQSMSPVARYANLTAVLLPFIALIAAIGLLWNEYVGWSDVVIFGVMYLSTALGITIGYHRMLTHRAFDAPKPVRYTLAVLGSMAVQGSVIDWVADHRKHHAFTDEEGDPHSPHGHGGGLKGALHGLWHAHMGWLWVTQGAAEKRKYARDLLQDRGIRKISRNFPWLVLAGLAIPAVLGFVLTGFSPMGALTAFVWGGLVRIFLVHHITWSINSICHFFGRRRFDIEDQSTNVFWLALPSLGESWHHNHHAFPTSARHGLRWWEIDVSGLIIHGLQKVGLAYDVVTVDAEKQREKEVPRAREREKEEAAAA
jgi:stearoyl-CoA desaturase (delta-9 desaturase)